MSIAGLSAGASPDAARREDVQRQEQERQALAAREDINARDAAKAIEHATQPMTQAVAPVQDVDHIRRKEFQQRSSRRRNVPGRF